MKAPPCKNSWPKFSPGNESETSFCQGNSNGKI